MSAPQWEQVTEDSTLKRIAVPGGWLYESWRSEWIVNIHGDNQNEWTAYAVTFVPCDTIEAKRRQPVGRIER